MSAPRTALKLNTGRGETARERHRREVRRRRAERKAEREERLRQARIQPQIPRSTFHRLSREVMRDAGGEDMLLGAKAVDALQAGAEAYLDEVFGRTVGMMQHAGRATMQQSDLQLAVRSMQGAPPGMCSVDLGGDVEEADSAEYCDEDAPESSSSDDECVAEDGGDGGDGGDGDLA